MFIKIHKYKHDPCGIDYLNDLKDRLISHKISQCLKSAGEFETFIDLNETLIYNSIRYKISDEKFLRASYKLILETIINNFKLAFSEKENVEIYLANQKGIIKKVKHNKWLCAGGYYHSFIVRADSFRKYLDAVDYDKYLVTLTEYDFFNYHHIRLLRQLGKDNKKALYEFQKGYKHLLSLKKEYKETFRVFYPLWEYIITNDEIKFNKMLQAAILAHQKEWSSNENDPDLGNTPRGHRNIFLTGIMSYAKDMGFNIDISSDYTPLYLIEGNIKVDVDSELDFMYSVKEISKEEMAADLKKCLATTPKA